MYTSDQSKIYSNSRALGYGQAEQCTQVSVLILKTCLSTKMWNGWPGLCHVLINSSRNKIHSLKGIIELIKIRKCPGEFLLNSPWYKTSPQILLEFSERRK